MARPLGTAPTMTQRVYDRLAAEINAGILPPGTRMQSMRGLAHQFSVSVAVINAAYNRLAQQGLIERVAGSCVRVSPRLKPKRTKLVGILTSYGRADIEDYYEPLLEIAAKHRLIPMVCVLKDHREWLHFARDLRQQAPDMMLVDVPWSSFPLEELYETLEPIPTCFCNRWEWHPNRPERAVLTDYAGAYAEGLRHLWRRGHDRILLLTHDPAAHPYAERFLATARQAARFEPEDSRLRALAIEHALEDPAWAGRTIADFSPGAILSVSDHNVVRLEEICPETAALDRIGFFDTVHSRRPGREFSTFRVDFAALWQKAAESLAAPAAVQTVKPALIRRWQHSSPAQERTR